MWSIETKKALLAHHPRVGAFLATAVRDPDAGIEHHRQVAVAEHSRAEEQSEPHVAGGSGDEGEPVVTIGFPEDF